MRASGLRGQIMEVTVWLHSHFWTSLATKQRPQKAGRVNSRRPRKSWDPTFPTPRKLLCTFFSEILWRITEKKIYPLSRDGSIKVVTGGFRTLEGGQMTTTTSCDGITNCWKWKTEAAQNLWWSSQGKGTDKPLLNFSLSSLVCLVCSKNSRTWHSVSPDWRVGFLMLLRLRGAPFRGFLLQEITRTKRTMGYSAPNELERFKHTHP